MRSIDVPRKKRGRPATGQDPVTAIRLSSELRAAIEAAGDKQKDGNPGRSEMIRRIVTDWLRKGGYLKAPK